MKRSVVALTVSLGLAAVSLPGPAAAAPIQTVKGFSQPIYSQSVTEEYRVPTRHGKIFGLVRRPVVPEGVKVPVILTYSPYNVQSRPTNLQASINDTYAGYYVPRGYARAVFDLVGTRESSGCYDYGGIRERESGADLVNFLGKQPWSNGRVGMIGASYDGTTAYAAAIEAPEHLTTIVPQVAIDRWYDYSYDGGVRRYSGFGTPLLFDFGFGATPPTGVNDPAHMAEVALTRVNPCDRVEHQIRGFGYDPVYDGFWDERDYRSKVSNVKASVLIEGGWLDTNVQPDGSLRFFQALPDDHPKKIVMGQWGHATPSLTDWRNVRHAWFDYWLLDYDGQDDDDDLPNTGVMDIPRMDTVLSGSNERIQQDTWPPVTTQSAPLRLVQGPGQGTDLGLVHGADTEFSDTNPSLGESEVTGGRCGEACVVFLGQPLSQSVRLAGTPFLDLAAMSWGPAHPAVTKVSTQFVGLLFVQTPSGSRDVITTGMLNSRNRNGPRVSEDVDAGQAYKGTLEFTDLDRLVPAGSRIGVAIASDVRFENLLPDDDPGARNRILVEHDQGLGTVLRLPVADGHAAFGL
ncbi:MAG TPA: CocE/NonD family hydrolase [Actinomycetota bacterium]|nr:CocE/NonD family hydrolase [Actinomycetota bacterium]